MPIGTDNGPDAGINEEVGKYFNVRHDCFGGASLPSGTYPVQQYANDSEDVIWSGSVQLWWSNDNSAHNGIAAFGRRDPRSSAENNQFTVNDTLKGKIRRWHNSDSVMFGS